MNIRLFISIVLLSSILGGCAFGPDQQNYVLNAPVLATPTQIRPTHVKVMPVEVAPGLNTARIAIIHNDVQMNYMADSKWAMPLPEMLQFLWIDALSHSGVVASASSDDTGAKADYLIQITATAFNAIRDSEGGVLVHVRYEVKILSSATHAVLSVDSASQFERVPVVGIEETILTFDKANGEAMRELISRLSKKFLTLPASSFNTPKAS